MDETQGGPGEEYTDRTTTPAAAPPPRRKSSGKKVIWILLLVVLAFLGGFGWQYYRAMNIEDQLERTEQALAVERLRVGLAQAAVAAQSGDYEGARLQMSEFFTATQQRLEELPPEVRAVARDLLLERDEVITGLSRANHEYAAVLYRMLQQFQTSTDPAAPVTPSPTEGTPGIDSGPAAGG